MKRVLLILFSYVLGSVSFSWLAVKVAKGKDLRDSGSKSLGATNSARELGLPVAVGIMIADMGKGYIPTRLAIKWFPQERWLHTIVATAASLGHARSIFLNFKGGKAMATSAGGFFALTSGDRNLWRPFELGSGVFVGAIAKTGIVSLGSVLGCFMMACYSLRLANFKRISRWYALWIVVMTAIITYFHKDNLKRIVRNEEPRTAHELITKLKNRV